MMKKCPHCGEEFGEELEEGKPVGGKTFTSHEESPEGLEGEFGDRIAKAVVAELKKNNKTAKRDSFEG